VTDKTDKRTRERLVELGEHLRQVRRSLGMSRVKLAEKIGMHPMNYARIEQGRQNVTVEMLLRIADGLGVPLTVRFARPRMKPS
jgi:transcriptional regulator with XRE-family HTH domain